MAEAKYAQTNPDVLKTLEAEEKELKFVAWNHNIAFDLGMFMRQRFLREYPEGGVMIQIRGFPSAPSGHPIILFSSMVCADDTRAAGGAIQLQGKANTVQASGMASFRAKTWAASMGWEPTKMGLTAPEHVVDGGGFPVRVTNVDSVVGCIVLSGMPDWMDHAFVVDSLREFLKQ